MFRGEGRGGGDMGATTYKYIFDKGNGTHGTLCMYRNLKSACVALPMLNLRCLQGLRDAVRGKGGKKKKLTDVKQYDLDSAESCIHCVSCLQHKTWLGALSTAAVATKVR